MRERGEIWTAFILPPNILCPSVFYSIASTTTGTYIYMESSAPRRPGDRADLVSQTFTPTQSRCVTFWYHMNGANIGTLSVLVRVSSNNYTVWTLSGDHGDKWIYAQAPVISNLDYQVSSAFYLFLFSLCGTARWDFVSAASCRSAVLLERYQGERHQ